VIALVVSAWLMVNPTKDTCAVRRPVKELHRKPIARPRLVRVERFGKAPKR
jgi:hypothetical protein